MPYKKTSIASLTQYIWHADNIVKYILDGIVLSDVSCCNVGIDIDVDIDID